MANDNGFIFIYLSVFVSFFPFSYFHICVYRFRFSLRLRQTHRYIQTPLFWVLRSSKNDGSSMHPYSDPVKRAQYEIKTKLDNIDGMENISENPSETVESNFFFLSLFVVSFCFAKSFPYITHTPYFMVFFCNTRLHFYSTRGGELLLFVLFSYYISFNFKWSWMFWLFEAFANNMIDRTFYCVKECGTSKFFRCGNRIKFIHMYTSPIWAQLTVYITQNEDAHDKVLS